MQEQATTPRMRYHGHGVWVCESTSQPGVGHMVHPASGRCTCRAGRYGNKNCKHLKMARQAEAWRVGQQAPAIQRPAGMAALQELFA